MSDLSDEQLARYGRQLVIPGFGPAAQAKLLAASALVVGAGGLGSPAAIYLAAAGVGRIGLVDGDVVDRSNLQRQILHRTADLGRPKVASGARSLGELNPAVEVVPCEARLTADNARELVGGYDVVVGALDNLPSRYVLNAACLAAGRPYVEAGVVRFEGLATTIIPHQTACYSCLFPVEPAPGALLSSAEAGVLGAVAGTLGTIQATEVIKLLTGIGTTLAGRLLVVDAREMVFRTIKVNRNPRCPACGAAPGGAGA